MKATDFGKVAVLLGGNSAEREVSLRSGQAVWEALCRRGVDAHRVDPGQDGWERLNRDGFDRVFIVLHGRGGEDGVIQGALETIGLPYTGSGVLGSALGMDKYRCKLAWQGLGLPTAPFVAARSAADLERVPAELGFPVMVKPAREGSSIGLARAENRDELEVAWQAAAAYDELVLVERWVQGTEYTCGILGDLALPLIRVETPNIFYDYQAKYLADNTSYLCPCGLKPALEQSFQELALKSFAAIGGSGWGRVDMLVDGSGTPWLLEVNTAPGMTDHSLVPMAARVAGIDFDSLVWKILENSVQAGAGSGARA